MANEKLYHAIIDGDINQLKASMPADINAPVPPSTTERAHGPAHVPGPRPRPLQLVFLSGRAAEKIPIDVVEHLLVSGADPNFQNGAGLPLCLALRCGHPKEAVELLISHGADVNRVEKGGIYALFLAVKYHSRNAELIQMLLDAGAELHPPGGRPDLEKLISYKREGSRLRLCELLGL